MAFIALSLVPASKTADAKLPKYMIGKGIWIYQTKSCEGSNVDKMVERALWAGLDHVLVKTHDGSRWVKYNTRDKVAEIIRQFHASGIKVYAWGYVYGLKPEDEARMAIEALEMGCDGYVFNAEIHMRGRPEAAETHCRLVREFVDSSCPDKVLGYSTFCRVQNQKEIPLEIYDRYCDVAMPQVYFSWFSGWSGRAAAIQTMNIWLAEQAKWDHPAKPLIPTLEASSGAADMPATDPKELHQAAYGFRGYYGQNFYAWDVSTSKLWNEIKEAPGNLEWQKEHNAAKAGVTVKSSLKAPWKTWLWRIFIVGLLLAYLFAGSPESKRSRDDILASIGWCIWDDGIVWAYNKLKERRK